MFSNLEIVFAIVPAIILFVYGIDNFGKEIQKSLGTQFNFMIRWATKGKIRSTLFGLIITAIIQASSATTMIAIGLVNSGVITFSQSIGIIFGANLGTTLTSQLIAFDLMRFAPIVIIFGFVLSLLKTKYRVFGKPIFYFGIILFALNLISINVIPLKNDPTIMLLLSKTNIIPLGIIIGFVITNLFQSSSVTTGLVVILAQNNLLGLQGAIPIILGAHIGTTILPLLIAFRMDIFAKRTALSHLMFNLLGMLFCVPLMGSIIFLIEMIGGNAGQQVANAHLITNLLTTTILLLFFNQFQKLVEKILPTKETEITMKTNNFNDLKNKKTDIIFDAIENELRHNFDTIIKTFNEIKVMVLTNDTKNNSKIFKLTALIEYIHSEIKRVLITIFKKPSKKESERILLLARTSTICEQIGTSSKKLAEIIINAKENQIDFSVDGKKDIDECLTKLNNNMLLIRNNYPNFNKKVSFKMVKIGRELRKIITNSYEEYLDNLSKGQSISGGIFAETLSTIQDLESNIREIRKICEK